MDNPSFPDPEFRILFVCLGNICRSPAAEIVFRTMIRKAGLEGRVAADSAGTIGVHQGNMPDERMLQSLRDNGYFYDGHRARQIVSADLESFDMIVTMDESNLRDVRSLDRPQKQQDKIRPMHGFLRKLSSHEIPDPYYGDVSGFQYVIRLLEDASAGLIEELKTRLDS